MKRHSRKCQGRTKDQFPGVFFSSPKTIFDKLEEHGITIPAAERFFPWFLVFDFEAMLISTQEPKMLKIESGNEILTSIKGRYSGLN